MDDPIERNLSELTAAYTRLMTASKVLRDPDQEATERAEIDRLLEERHGLTGGAS